MSRRCSTIAATSTAENERPLRNGSSSIRLSRFRIRLPISTNRPKSPQHGEAPLHRFAGEGVQHDVYALAAGRTSKSSSANERECESKTAFTPMSRSRARFSSLPAVA